MKTKTKLKINQNENHTDLSDEQNKWSRQRGPKQKLRAGYKAPSLKRTSHDATRFHRRVSYRALSLRCACIRSSDVILIGYRNLTLTLSAEPYD